MRPFLALLTTFTLGSALGQPTPVKQSLTVTPDVKARLNEIARLKTGRVCSGQYRAVDALSGTTATDLDAYYKILYAVFEKAVKDQGNGSTIQGELQAGVTGYMYINNTKPSAQDMLLTIFQAPYNGSNHIFMHGCDLK